MSHVAIIGFQIESLWIALAVSCVGQGLSPRSSDTVGHWNRLRFPGPCAPVVGTVWPEASDPCITAYDSVCRLVPYDATINAPKGHDSRFVARAAEATARQPETSVQQQGGWSLSSIRNGTAAGAERILDRLANRIRNRVFVLTIIRHACPGFCRDAGASLTETPGQREGPVRTACTDSVPVCFAVSGELACQASRTPREAR